jgi:alpha-N-arabinofuranosidase
VNLAYWDDQLTTTETQTMVEAAGLAIFRFPGGSASDDYHFNSSSNDGDSSANTIPQFAQFIDNVGGLGIVTIDYGSGSPQEAEAELAYLKVRRPTRQ